MTYHLPTPDERRQLGGIHKKIRKEATCGRCGSTASFGPGFIAIDNVSGSFVEVRTCEDEHEWVDPEPLIEATPGDSTYFDLG